MTAAVMPILWGHALAALLFVGAALAMRGEAILPRAPIVAASSLTALWALAVAGIDTHDVSVRAILGVRDVAWLAVLLVLTRRVRRPDGAMIALYAAAMTVALLAAAVAVAEASVAGPPSLIVDLIQLRQWLRALGLLAALILVNQTQAEAGSTTPAVRLIAIALGLMWGGDLLLLAVRHAMRSSPTGLIAVRGGLMAVVALLIATSAGRGAGRPLAVSRAAAVRLLAIVGLAGYAGLIALLTGLADAYAGGQARVVQTGIVFGATAALLTLLSTPWLRAWGKVMLAKHLFSHRFDYRAEWQRFSETLAGAPAATAPLGERVTRAIADLTVSPAALLLVAEGEGLVGSAASCWSDAPVVDDAVALARHLAASGRVVELDAVRAGEAPGDENAAVPATLLSHPEAWAIVPLAHRGGLVGAVVLARPPVDRALDWEDFDLLRVAGRQAAGALAEDGARRALADAERFDEFNRRFAFILHDIKNLVSQLSLVARNAQRHADNPVFRADMIATLTESSERMQALLARLSPQASRREPVQPVELAGLLDRIAARRSGGHPISCQVLPGLWALAERPGLEMVVEHLLQNAIDASASDAPVVLAATGQDGDVTIEVADRGSGMSAAFVREQLFRPFVSTKSGGFGLGAFEARQLVEAMGGRLEVASREGEGTRVALHLPAAASVEIAA